MKTSPLLRIALVALALGSAGLTTTFAQTPVATPAPAATASTPPPLTEEEKAQLKKDREQVIASNPDLKAQEASLKQQREAATTPEAKKALRPAMEDFNQKVRAAVLKIDPSAAPIYAKLDALKEAHHHQKAA